MSLSGLSWSELNLKKQELDKNQFSSNSRIRIHRAISWLKCAENNEQDIDLKFISLWISFNSCYSGIEGNDDLISSENEKFDRFITSIVELDSHGIIHNVIWDKFSDSIRVLLNNKYAYKDFWSSIKYNNNNWEKSFEHSNRKAFEFLASRRTTAEFILIVLARLYTVRNQIVHGGATYQSFVNRGQVRDASEILSFLVPAFILIMIENPDIEWGELKYPRVD